MSIVRAKNVNFRFNNLEQILTNINLNIPEGSIYGFLGPNGAGKTTTLKLLLGLLTIQQGEIDIFNKSLTNNRIDILNHIGSMIESPSIYSHLSAFENLKVIGTIFNSSNERINEILTIVGLSNTGSKIAGNFSLGMKQRLSLGIALLNNPKLLILDEPTNGLDPNGIIEIRELLKNINKIYGTTIIISSHILSEIEKLVSHLAIIDKGSLLFQGTIGDLNSMQQNSINVILETNDNKSALLILNEMYVECLEIESKIQFQFVSNELTSEIINNLINSGIRVYELSKEKHNLENIFMNLIQK